MVYIVQIRIYISEKIIVIAFVCYCVLSIFVIQFIEIIRTCTIKGQLTFILPVTHVIG